MQLGAGTHQPGPSIERRRRTAFRRADRAVVPAGIETYSWCPEGTRTIIVIRCKQWNYVFRAQVIPTIFPRQMRRKRIDRSPAPPPIKMSLDHVKAHLNLILLGRFKLSKGCLRGVNQLNAFQFGHNIVS